MCNVLVGCKTSLACNSPSSLDIYKGLVEALQSQKAGGGDMFTAVLDKAFQSGISSQSLDREIDMEAERERNKARLKKKSLKPW